MRKLFLVAGLAVAALVPSLASAQQSCESQRGGQVAGTVVGAGLGALIGSAIGGRGNHTTGAVIGGVSGAVIANSASAPSADCAHAYGYYDRDSQWHANAVARENAQGYYDRNGAWVVGAPTGHYDTAGRWVVTGAYGSPVVYPNGQFQSGARRDIYTRENRLEQRISSAIDNGSLSRADARDDTHTLNSIRRQERELRGADGRLSQRDEDRLQGRLDQLSDQLRQSIGEDRG